LINNFKKRRLLFYHAGHAFSLRTLPFFLSCLKKVHILQCNCLKLILTSKINTLPGASKCDFISGKFTVDMN